MTEEAILPSEAPFSPGRTLAVSFGVFGRNLPAFLIITVTLSFPYIVFQTWLDFALSRAGEGGSGLEVANLGMFVVQVICFGLVQAALTYGSVQDLHGRKAGIMNCFEHGLVHTGNVIAGALRYGVLLSLATLLLIVPGVVLYLRWWVFMPAMVVEDLTPHESFVRSKALTAGRCWAILGLAATVFLAQIAVLLGVVLFLGGLAGDIAATLLAIFFSSFNSVLAAVGYTHLRLEKEGVAIDAIASVFD